MLKLWDVIKLNSFNDILKILTLLTTNFQWIFYANFVGARSCLRAVARQRAMKFFHRAMKFFSRKSV